MKKILYLLLIVSITAFAQIKKVEPPFWWAGMENTELQIMLYGNKIAKCDVVLTNGMTALDVFKPANPNYIFVTVNTANLNPGTFDILLKDGKKTMYKYTYELKTRVENSASRKGFDSSDMMYLLMPDRFANGNPKNDSQPDMAEKANRGFDSGRHGGDIEGIIKHLDYLQELGITALWSTPLLEDNEPKYSYHTYAQSDYYRIDPRFGSNEDYKNLADELHQRKMKLVMDYVTNHWGSKHWLIRDLPFPEWIHQWPDNGGFRRSNYRMTTQFDSNAAQIDIAACMDGWFDTTMPDINQSNPIVLNYLIQNAIWWIEFAGLDGLRVDTYSYNDKEGIATWTKAIMDEYPNFNIVGEVWMHSQAQMAYWQKDSEIGAIQNYNSNLPSVMDFTLHDAISVMFDEQTKFSWQNEGIMRAYENFSNDFLYPNIDNILVFAENHDTNRINQIYKNDFDKYRLAMTLIATVRGIPQVYYGSEIGMAGDKSKGDGDIRKDFPGGWEGDANNAFTQAGRTAEQNQYFDFTSKLFQWRKSKPVIHYGKTMHYVPENNVYVYFRYDDNDTVMVVMNNSDQDQSVEPKRFAERIQNYSKGRDALSGVSVDVTNAIFVKSKSTLVLELEK